MNAGRLVTTLVVLGAVVGALVALSSGSDSGLVAEITSDDPAVDPAVFRTADGCGTCHEGVYREWRSSWHAQAMTDTYFLGKLRDTPTGEENPACLPCHIPLPIHETGFGMRPRVRGVDERRSDGIDCITCHKKGNGVAASRPGLEGACNPIHTPDSTGTKTCFGCHNQHWTVDEWERSEYSREGTRRTCLDCHMPFVEIPESAGSPARRRRSHAMHGGRHLPEVRKAVTFGATVEGRSLVVSTENSGAGHKIPTDSRHRSFNVLVWFHDASGNRVAGPMEIAEYRLYYRQELREVESTQILPGDTALARLALPEGLTKGKAVARLYYCLTPIIAGKLRQRPERSSAALVAEATVEIE